MGSMERGESQATLPAMLAGRARAASDGRLVLDVLGGVLAASALALWRPPAWLLLFGAAVCFAAFGFWGIADRELRERSASPASRGVWTLEAARWVSGLVGLLAVLLVIFTILGRMLGTWIS